MTVISAPQTFNEEDLYIDLRLIVEQSLFLKCEGFNFAGSIKLKAATEMVEVLAPHTWQELVDVTATLDPTTGQPPDWIVPSGGVGDLAGSGVPATGTVQLHEGTYGPVCLTGEWPDVSYRAGEPFAVGRP